MLSKRERSSWVSVKFKSGAKLQKQRQETSSNIRNGANGGSSDNELSENVLRTNWFSNCWLMMKLLKWKQQKVNNNVSAANVQLMRHWDKNLWATHRELVQWLHLDMSVMVHFTGHTLIWHLWTHNISLKCSHRVGFTALPCHFGRVPGGGGACLPKHKRLVRLFTSMPLWMQATQVSSLSHLQWEICWNP